MTSLRIRIIANPLLASSTTSRRFCDIRKSFPMFLVGAAKRRFEFQPIRQAGGVPEIPKEQRLDRAGACYLRPHTSLSSRKRSANYLFRTVTRDLLHATTGKYRVIQTKIFDIPRRISVLVAMLHKQPAFLTASPR